MVELTFGANSGQTGRRRRLMVAEVHADSGAAAEELRDPVSRSGESAAFPLLSRDRMIRRVISPRLWKHAIVACGLTGIPMMLAAGRIWADSPAAADEDVAGLVAVLRGIAGLGLFLSAQLCLLICWVRSASAVDFRGGFRAWRWMAVLLCGASVVMLTGTASALTNGIAAILQPLLGSLDASRPALLHVPAGACLAFVLRYLIPDMGRCRPAQALLVCGVGLTIGRVLFGMRADSGNDLHGLVILELLTTGLLLSAFQLHGRYVIHVNPNPPVAVRPTRRVEVSAEPLADVTANEVATTGAAVLDVRVPDLPVTAKDQTKGKLSKKPLRRAG